MLPFPAIVPVKPEELSPFEKFNQLVANALGTVYGMSIGYVLIVVLLGFGIYATIRTGAVQFTMFSKM